MDHNLLDLILQTKEIFEMDFDFDRKCLVSDAIYRGALSEN